MLKKQIKNYTLLIIGIISIIISMLILIKGRDLLELIIFLVGSLLIVNNIINLLLVHYKKYKLIDTLVKTIVNIVFGLLIIIFNNQIITSCSLIFALYTLLIALVNIISYIIYVKNNIKWKINLFINFVTSLIFSFILIINPSLNIKYVLIILSIYLVLYGIKNIIDFIFQILPKKITNKIKSRIDFAIPLIFAIFIPQALLKEINEILKVDKDFKIDYEKGKEKPKLFVIIRLAKSGSASFGHIEVSYKDKIYSYGNYNKHSRHLFDSIGDGIILVADKEKYINYCITNKKRYLIEFGIALNEVEEKEIENRINKLLIDTIEYKPDLQLYEEGLIEYGEYKDMSSEIYKYACGKFYKITKGKNKIFFVLKNNCAAVAEQILKGSGKRIIKFSGIITPGTYYDYLNQAFLLKNSNVVSKKIYMEDLCQNYQK